MATEAVSGNDEDNHQSINTATPVASSFPDSRYDSLKKIQQFPKHDTVRLSEHNFILWKQQVLLILEGYGLHDFVLGTVNVPSQSIVDKDGNLVANPDFLFHKQQDILLMLLSKMVLMIEMLDSLIEVLDHLTGALVLGRFKVEVEGGGVSNETMQVHYHQFQDPSVFQCGGSHCCSQSPPIQHSGLQANVASSKG
ncbi:hypothetical protein PVK06_018978 [Gossypium arboreum]|uniref:Retrotransposon Copia-like N-terminal domain-containing protein n=1 Tax=Gossypium arboreum TaxID=29729 RepID=A0ABR0PIG7_GOSAR|nr:hypothetical protein PVK06_018978 [Gossypium arboreum]